MLIVNKEYKNLIVFLQESPAHQRQPQRRHSMTFTSMTLVRLFNYLFD